MDYTHGQKVKVHFKRPNDKAAAWHNGVYDHKQGEQHVIRCANGSERFVPAYDNEVAPFFPILNDEELIEFGKANVAEVTGWLDKAFAALLPEFVGQAKVTNTDTEVSVAVGCITITPSIMEVHGLSGFREVVGWEVSTLKHVPGNREVPDDYEPVTLEQHREEMAIAAAAVNRLFTFKAAGFWEAEGDRLTAEEMDRDDKLAKEYWASERKG